MKAKGLTPILNVSDIAASFAWFEKWDWRKCWDWGTPATFGAVGSGECEIFLCQGAQGGRGRGANTTTFQQDGDEQADKGSWMSVWVDDVDGVHTQTRTGTSFGSAAAMSATKKKFKGDAQVSSRTEVVIVPNGPALAMQLSPRAHESQGCSAMGRASVLPL